MTDSSTITRIRRTKKEYHEQLRQIALKNGPGAKLPTTRELRMALDVDARTLNDVLNGLEAENVIHRKDRSGIYVSHKLHCKNIRVLLDASLVDVEPVSPFWGLLWGKLVKEAKNRKPHMNEDVTVHLVAPDHDSAELLPPDVMKGLDAGQIHGVLNVGMNAHRDGLIVSRDVPMVSYASMGHWQVIIQSDAVIAESIRRLAGLGCRTIGFLRPSYRLTMMPAEIAGYDATLRNLLEENRVGYHRELIRYGTFSMAEMEKNPAKQEAALASVNSRVDYSYQDEGYDAAMRFFSDPGSIRPEGLVIEDDMLTSGALLALQEMGIRPGVDVKIASQSNSGSALLHGLERKLLLWKVDPAEIAHAMFSLLDRLMAGERPEERVAWIEARFPS